MNLPPKSNRADRCAPPSSHPLTLALLLLAAASGGCDRSRTAPRGVGQAPPTDGGSGPPSTYHSTVPPAGPTGTWYLNEAGTAMTMTLDCPIGAPCTGQTVDSIGGVAYLVDRVSYTAATGELTFRRSSSGVVRFYRTRIVEGVLVGRVAAPAEPDLAPTDPTAYAAHLTGWKGEYFDRDLAPRVYDLLLDGNEHARLRLDRAPAGAGFVVRFKVYATEANGASDEGDEYDGVVSAWDGSRLSWDLAAPPPFDRSFSATVDGRRIGGSFVQASQPDASHSFSGARAEVLGHGFSGMTIADRADWQARTRRMLAILAMGENPAPLSSSVTVVRQGLQPFVAQNDLFDRDDSADSYPQAYTLKELRFDYALPDPQGGAPLSRTTHGFLATPTAPPPPSGYPLVVAINGHSGSAAQVMMPDNEDFWYGDSFARRGYLVLSIDISHRPPEDRRGLYAGSEGGDDPDNGNGAHPAVKSPGMDSDWEEDGERAWDVLRGLDWLLSLPGVDASQVVLTGLSMGGEITAFAGAMDPRFTAVVAAGFSPDLSALVYRGSHGCWQWLNGEVREYIDSSDLFALVAPRPLIVQTGRQDYIYSIHSPPFAADKQVLRRVRPEWSDAPGRVLHYLHYDAHHYHVGGLDPWKAVESNVRLPEQTDPGSYGASDWQDDGATYDSGLDLYGTLAALR